MANHWNSVKLSKDYARLAIQNVQKSKHFGGAKVRHGELAKMMLRYIEGSMKHGVCDFLYHQGELEGILLLGKNRLARDLKVWFGTAEIKGNARSKRWLQDKFLYHQDLLCDRNLMFDLPQHLEKLLPYFLKSGFHIESVRSMASPKLAYRNLIRLKNPPAGLDDLGYSIVRPNKRDLEMVLKIERNEFKRNPQYGWFVSRNEWLQESLRRRVIMLKEKGSSIYVIKDKKKVRGYFSCTFRKSPMWGKLAEPEFVFDQGIQGKGFSKTAYRTVLEDMLKKKSDFFRGNTAQGPVIGLGKLMGRKPTSYFLKYGKGHFKAAHFKM